MCINLTCFLGLVAPHTSAAAEKASVSLSFSCDGNTIYSQLWDRHSDFSQRESAHLFGMEMTNPIWGWLIHTFPQTETKDVGENRPIKRSLQSLETTVQPGRRRTSYFDKILLQEMNKTSTEIYSHFKSGEWRPMTGFCANWPYRINRYFASYAICMISHNLIHWSDQCLCIK